MKQCPDLDPCEMCCYICHKNTHRTADCRVSEKSLKRQASMSSASSNGSHKSKTPYNTKFVFHVSSPVTSTHTNEWINGRHASWIALDVLMTDAPDIQASTFTRTERGWESTMNERRETRCQRMLIADRDRDIFMFDVDRCPYCGFYV